MSKIAVQLLSWNGKDVLPGCLEALAAQTYRDFELLALDNGSTDGSAALVEERLKVFPRPVRFFKKGENSGFAGGHNELFVMSDAPYVCCVNQDTVPSPEYLERCVAFLENNPAVGSVSGVLRRPNGSVDSAGLSKNWYCRVRDLRDEPEFPETPVFGVSGSLPVYRRAAVLEVSPDGKLFDANFFAYKEDVDLAWRLDLFGWKSYALSGALARHSRGFGGEKKWKREHHFRQKLSSRNHLLMLAKDLQFHDFWRLPGIVVYEIGKAVYTALFVTRALGYITGFFRLLPKTLAARHAVADKLEKKEQTHG
jgi:GT2 family glycosyltransferase